jgi:hypothetical protein
MSGNPLIASEWSDAIQVQAFLQRRIGAVVQLSVVRGNRRIELDLVPIELKD